MARDDFHQGVQAQQVAPGKAEPGGPPGAQGQARQEAGQHQGLGVGGVAQVEFEIVGPDGLVNKPRHPGQQKRRHQDSPDETAFSRFLDGYSLTGWILCGI